MRGNCLAAKLQSLFCRASCTCQPCVFHIVLGKEGRDYVQMALGEVVRAVVHDTEVNGAEFILDASYALLALYNYCV